MTERRLLLSPKGAQMVKADRELVRRVQEVAVSFRAFLPFFRFRSPDTHEVLFLDELWTGQDRLVEVMEAHSRIIDLKSRKLGHSTLATAWDLHVAMTLANARVHLFSRREDAAIDLLERVKFAVSGLPDWMRPPVLRKTSTTLELGAGEDVRVIQAYPADDDTAVEQQSSHSHVDEWGRMTNPLRVLQSIEPTIGSGSAHILFTSRGAAHSTSEFYRRSQDGDTGFHALFVPSVGSKPEYTEDWAVMKERELGRVAFSMEYPRSTDEALNAGGDLVFRGDDLDVAVELSRGPQPPTAGRKYVKAWDIADSQDFAVGVVLDVTAPMHDVVYFERHRGIGYPALQKRIEWVHRRYGGPTVIEDNAMGAAVRQNLDIPPHEVVPFTTTAKSKARIIAGLEVAIENETLTYDSGAWPELDRELRSYVRDDKDIHQDTVMALGLAEEHAVLGQLAARRKGRGRIIEVGSGAPGRYPDPRRALGRSG